MAYPSLLGNVQRPPRIYWLSVAIIFLGLIAGLPSRAMAPRHFHTGQTQRGVASWYGTEQGHHTASGERFDPDALTAAHRYLPFNTIIRVTNQLNGKSVELRVNDRGPFRHGRVLDVTSAAADVLDMKRAGAVPVVIEVLELGAPTHANNG